MSYRRTWDKRENRLVLFHCELRDKLNSITILKKIPKATGGFMKEFNNKEQNNIKFFVKTNMERKEILFPPGAWGSRIY